MAPFLSHLVIGERVWLALEGRRPASDGYGLFLFGCLAPDVDKFGPGLDLQRFVRDALERSCQRSACLLAEENVQ